ncbi:MAG: O-antigen ligase family protein [Phycisphaeraceae bacterium]|nr:O-antigen ligase family protein [Phycisphaeraceae bacterium]
MAWERISAAEAQQLADGQRSADPFGTRLHAAFAAMTCFFAGWPTSFVAWAGLPLLICFVVRMTGHWRVLGPLFWQTSTRFLVAWSLWIGLSLLWSMDRSQGVKEIGPSMFGLFILGIWPVIDHRRLLVGAIVAGVFCGQLSQLAHGIGPTLGIDAITFNRLPGRNSGWWDPVVGGSVLCAALGLHMAAAFTGAKRWVRLLGMAGMALCVTSIAATGTRGAWIGALFTIGAGLVVCGWWSVRTRDRRIARNVLLFAAVGIVTLTANLAARPAAIQTRYEAAVREVRAALREGDYRSDTGLRIAMAQWAFAAARCSPLVGVGAGGFKPWVLRESETAREAAARGEPRRGCASIGPVDGGGDGVHAHAHSWFPHVLATTGIVGLVIMLGLVVSAIREGLIGACRFGVGGYAEIGPAMGLIGLIGAGLFDSISVNQQTWNMAMVLLALCGVLRPRCVRSEGEAEARSVRD